MQENKQLLVILHLSQLFDLISGFGGLIIPFVLWITKKEEVFEMDYHGKNVINFQLSMFLYSLLAIPMIFFFGLGYILLGVIALLILFFSIINAINASKGRDSHYPFSIRFIKS